jgi:SAM domain (Sterile alpha motif)
LASLGLSQYAQRFAESDIDASILRDLTDRDLKDIRISLGYRRRLLRAIPEFAGTEPTPRPVAAAAAPPQDSAVACQLTVGHQFETRPLEKRKKLWKHVRQSSPPTRSPKSLGSSGSAKPAWCFTAGLAEKHYCAVIQHAVLKDCGRISSAVESIES